MRILLLLGIVVYYATTLNTGIANAESYFDGKFFKAVVEDKFGNTICSPVSAELSVIAAGIGANGRTLRQIQSLITNTDKDGSARIISFVNTHENYKGVELRIACKAFVAKGYSLKSHFKSMIQQLFESSVENIDFGNAVEASKTINDWSAAHTNNRIKELVTPAGIEPDSAVVLLNAVYFKGLWANPFDANATRLSIFYVNGIRPEIVPTMYKFGKYLYGELPELNASFIEIPYKTDNFRYGVSMYIILPNEMDGFIELKKNFDQVTVEMLRNSDVVAGDVELSLPKFKIESSLDLTGPLMKMGLTDMFSDGADFNGIVQNGNLKISKIIQKAFLEVNEEGSEAGAITEADMMDRISPPPLRQFTVDRPFFSVIATESKVTLFSALVADPWY